MAKELAYEDFVPTAKYWWATMHMPRTHDELFALIKAAQDPTFEQKMNAEIDSRIRSAMKIDDETISSWVEKQRPLTST